MSLIVFNEKEMSLNVFSKWFKIWLETKVQPGIESLHKEAYTHLELCLSQNASCLTGAPTRDLFYTLHLILGRHRET